MKFLLTSLTAVFLAAGSSSAINIFLASDSTCAYNPHNATQFIYGWGTYLPPYFSAPVAVQNVAKAGYSTRTYIREGFWQEVVDRLVPGDVVLLQWGHNDGSPINDDTRSRGVIPSLGNEYQDIINDVTHLPERVYTFGHYLSQMANDTISKGAHPIPVPMTLNKNFNVTTGKITRGNTWADLAYEFAQKSKLPFIDSRNIMADTFDALTQDQITALYQPGGGTHFVAAGANLVARSTVNAFKCLHSYPAILDYVSPSGKAIPLPKHCYRTALDASVAPAVERRGSLRRRAGM
ncbi:hypothetical protein HKX48_008810 [Thoreauomyces humboldtii]|nr:hypothetical protein HKX48_008810 [Thoreauomyces humboldtii]